MSPQPITADFSKYTKDQLTAVFNPLMLRLRTLLNKYQFWPEDNEHKESIRDAVTRMAVILNRVPPNCKHIFAGNAVCALFRALAKNPQWLQPGHYIDTSCLQSIKSDPPHTLMPFDDDQPMVFVEACIQESAAWNPAPPSLPDVAPTPTAPLDNAIPAVEKGKGKEVEKDLEDKGDAAQDEDVEMDDEGEDEHSGSEERRNRSDAHLRRSPRKKASATTAAAAPSSSSPRPACDLCLRLRLTAEIDRDNKRTYAKDHIGLVCVPHSNPKKPCLRCGQKKKGCSSNFNGDSAALLASLRQQKQKKEEQRLTKKEGGTSKKRKSAALVHSSDDEDDTGAVKKTRTSPFTAPQGTSAAIRPRKAAAVAQPAASSAATVEVIAMSGGANAHSGSPTSVPRVVAGTKEFGLMFHPKSGQAIPLQPAYPTASSTSDRVLVAYPTELPTGDLVKDVVASIDKQDGIEERLTQVEAAVRSLSAQTQTVPQIAQQGMVPMSEYQDLRRKVFTLQKIVDEKDSQLTRMVDNAVKLVSTVEDRMKVYDQRLALIEGQEGRDQKSVLVHDDPVEDAGLLKDLERKVNSIDRDVDKSFRSMKEVKNSIRRIDKDIDKIWQRAMGSVNEATLNELLGRMSALHHQCHSTAAHYFQNQYFDGYQYRDQGHQYGDQQDHDGYDYGNEQDFEVQPTITPPPVNHIGIQTEPSDSARYLAPSSSNEDPPAAATVARSAPLPPTDSVGDAPQLSASPLAPPVTSAGGRPDDPTRGRDDVVAAHPSNSAAPAPFPNSAPGIQGPISISTFLPAAPFTSEDGLAVPDSPLSSISNGEGPPPKPSPKRRKGRVGLPDAVANPPQPRRSNRVNKS